jgi:glutaminase
MASRNSSAAGWMECERILDRVAGAVRGVLGSGRVADQIPALASADPHMFGLAVATVEGEVHGVGEWRRRFSIQSISKVFTLALVIEKDGEALWTRVGREPSGTSFNSLVQLEHERGIPRNPFINAGALVVTDRLPKLSMVTGTPRSLISWRATATLKTRSVVCLITTSATAPSR